jgi:hypothetical protein
MVECVEHGPESVDWVEEVRRDPHPALTAAVELSFGGGTWDGTEAADLQMEEPDPQMEEPGPPSDAEEPCGPRIGLDAGVAGSEFFYLMDAMAGLGFEETAARVICQKKEEFGEFYEGTTSSLRLWFFGNWEASRGNAAAAEGVATWMEENLPNSGDPRFDGLLTRAVVAEAALARGDRDRAHRLLEELHPSGVANDILWHLAEPLGPSRMALARLLLESGDYAEALRVAEGFDGNASAYLVYLPESLEIRREAAAALGLTERAEEYESRLRVIREGGG